MNFDTENGHKNELKDNNEKSRSWSGNRVSLKIFFKALWPQCGLADSVGASATNKSKFIYRFEKLTFHEFEKYFQPVNYSNQRLNDVVHKRLTSSFRKTAYWTKLIKMLIY